MFQADERSLARRAVYHLGLVHCPNCRNSIRVSSPGTVTEEFSVYCNRCGRRSIHDRRTIQIEELPERRHTRRA